MRISRLFSPFLCTTFGLGLAAGSALAQAPALTALAPTRHQLAVPTGTSVAATFDQPLDNTAGTRAALKVFSSQRGGLLRDGRGGTATVSANTLSLAPTVAFRPGETVLTTLTPALTANGGSALARGRTASFTTAVSSTSPGLFRRLIPTGALNGPLDVAAADVDGDGDLDFLSSTSQNVVGVRFNNGTGTFSGSGSVNVGAFPVSMAVGDLDGDGDLDFVTANRSNTQSSNTVSVRLNDSHGVFTPHLVTPEVQVQYAPNYVALGDVDGDGDLDFVTANNSSGGKVSLRLNDGTGGFSGTVDVPVGLVPASVALADVDGDGDLDIVAGNINSSSASVRFNDGTGTYTAPAANGEIALPGGPHDLALADVDGDGDLDLLAASGVVSLRVNNGQGVFSTPATNADISTDGGPKGLMLGDLDGDGDLDLAVACNSTNSVNFRFNNGAGVFSVPALLPSAGAEALPQKVALADVDGDGDLDALCTALNVINNNTNPVSVFMNQRTGITSFTPTSGSVGSVVVITGTGFTGATAVTVNGTAASSFTIDSPTQITFVVGPGSSSGPVRVVGLDGTGPGNTFTVASNQAPTALNLSNLSLAENTGPNALVGTLNTTDPNPGNTFTYTLVSGSGSTDNALVNLSGPALRITASPDFETKASYAVRVRTTDQGGLFLERAFTIVITDVAEAPALTSLSPATGPVGTTVNLTGAGFAGATAVRFNGVAATTFSIGSGTAATAVVPAGASSGPVTVTNAVGPSNGVAFAVTTVALTVSGGSAGSPVSIAPGTYTTLTVAAGGFGQLTGPVTVGGTLVVNGSLDPNCQALTGPGSFVLAAGATLYVCDPAGLSATAATGTVQVTGLRSFAADASYVYNGGVAQVTGTGLPATVRNLTVANAAGLALTNALGVTQVVRLASGNLATGPATALTLRSTAGSGGGPTDGLTALLDNGPGAAEVTGTANVLQRAVDNGLTGDNIGYHHYGSPMAAATPATLAAPGFAPVFNQAYNTAAQGGTVRPFPTVFGYDESRVGNPQYGLDQLPFDQGYVVPAAAGPWTPGTAYTANVPNAVTVNFVGQFNNAPTSATTFAGLQNLSRGPHPASGWHLLGNPFPSPLDFATVDFASQATNLDAAIYQYHATSRYAGYFTTYLGNVNLGTQPQVPAGGGFFVRVSTPNTATGALRLTNANRVTSYGPQASFGRAAAGTRPVLTLALAAATGPADALTLYLDPAATPGLDAAYDAAKLPNPSGLNLAATAATGEALAIDGLPALGRAPVLVPLQVALPAAGRYTLTATALANFGATLVLHDARTGTRTALAAGTSYGFTSAATAAASGRFVLEISPAATALAAGGPALAAQVQLYPNPATGRVRLHRPAAHAATVALANALGQQVLARALPTADTDLDLRGLPPGVYTLRLTLDGGPALTWRLVLE